MRTCITRDFLSINEGGRFITFHLRWRPSWFVYIYLFGRRFYGPRRKR